MGIKISDTDFRCSSCIDTSEFERFTHSADADKRCTYCKGPVAVAEAPKLRPELMDRIVASTCYRMITAQRSASRARSNTRAMKIRKELSDYAAANGLTLAGARAKGEAYGAAYYG